MNFFDYMDDLKSRPTHVRRRFAIMFSTVFCGVIFIAWLMVVTSRPTTFHYTSSESSSATPMDSITGSLKEITEEIKNFGEVFRGLTGEKVGDESGNTADSDGGGLPAEDGLIFTGEAEGVGTGEIFRDTLPEND